MIETLLTFYAGKNSRKRKRILKVLENIKFKEQSKELFVKVFLIQRKNKQLYSDSPKDWFCECEATSYTKYEIFDDTKEGNGKHAIRWNLNVKLNSMRYAANLKEVVKDTETMAQVEG